MVERFKPRVERKEKGKKVASLGEIVGEILIYISDVKLTSFDSIPRNTLFIRNYIVIIVKEN